MDTELLPFWDFIARWGVALILLIWILALPAVVVLIGLELRRAE